jgi:exodeoxyribonuclease-1
MSRQTFFWHDYETFGINPARDRPVQFAGVRTDDQLHPTGEQLVIYSKPVADVLPSPEACLITGITPQIAMARGVIEAEFISQINRQLSVPGTCGAGYNSIRFDDEVTRYTLYRNFLDPYAREWQNDCSRWDIIDLVRMTYALRPNGINWPQNDQGKPSFKLEHLALANGVKHEDAHDALSDVFATIELAKLLRKAQPKLFDWLLTLRNKHQVAQQIDAQNGKPLVHTTRMYPSEYGCTSVVMPLTYESRNKSSVLVYDLRQDPSEFIELDQDELAVRLFTAANKLPEDASRLPVKSLKINHCPAIAPVESMREQDAARINLDLDRCAEHRRVILSAPDFTERVEQAFCAREFPPDPDVDQALYSGFFPDSDKRLIVQIQAMGPDQLAKAEFTFADQRLPELLFRYRARNWPDSLSAQEIERWREFCMQRYQDPEDGLESYFEKISVLRNQHSGDSRIENILDELEQWADELVSAV